MFIRRPQYMCDLVKILLSKSGCFPYNHKQIMSDIKTFFFKRKGILEKGATGARLQEALELSKLEM